MYKHVHIHTCVSDQGRCIKSLVRWLQQGGSAEERRRSQLPFLPRAAAAPHRETLPEGENAGDRQNEDLHIRL